VGKFPTRRGFSGIFVRFCALGRAEITAAPLPIGADFYGLDQEGMVMGFRFRKRIKILPGVWFNLSKSGVSTSIGGKGLTVNLKNGKTKTTVGIPGTGLSYSETTTGKLDELPAERRAISAWLWLLLVVVIVLVFAVK
jgi:hypothetical protein